jgi:hypothetical protein
VSASPHRYGDFPDLFWDAEPDAAIDGRSPVVLARLLSRGSMDAIRAVVDPGVLAEALPNLPIDDHVRRFWKRVLELRTARRAR